MEHEIRVRAARTEDAEKLLEIYAPYVEKTAVSFEYVTPGVSEFAGRIRRTVIRYPYLIAETKGQTLGYAYAGSFIGRPAYDWSVETTIYLRQNARRMGIGRALYGVLEKELRAMGILNMNACIAAGSADEYLTRDSVLFHEKMGFKMVGTFHDSGYKFNRWYDMLWMEKIIGDHKESQPPPRPFAGVEETRLIWRKSGWEESH